MSAKAKITNYTQDNYTQDIVLIVKRLPEEQLAHLLNYARFLDSQTVNTPKEWLVDATDESEEEIIASERKWDELFLRPDAQQLMEQMALEALAEAETNQTVALRFDRRGELITEKDALVQTVA
jgi:hypothetical protein